MAVLRHLGEPGITQGKAASSMRFRASFFRANTNTLAKSWSWGSTRFPCRSPGGVYPDSRSADRDNRSASRRIGTFRGGCVRQTRGAFTQGSRRPWGRWELSKSHQRLPS